MASPTSRTMLAGLILVSFLLSGVQGCKEKPTTPRPTAPPPRPPPPPPPKPRKIRLLLVVGGTKGDNCSTSTVELLPLDEPVSSKCRNVANLPKKLDRATGANVFSFQDVKKRCDCFVPPWYRGKGPRKYPEYFTHKDKVKLQRKDKCCCPGEYGIPYEKSVSGEAGHFGKWQAKKGVRWCRKATGPIICGGRLCGVCNGGYGDGGYGDGGYGRSGSYGGGGYGGGSKSNGCSQSRTCWQYDKKTGTWKTRSSKSSGSTSVFLNQPRELSAGMMHFPLGFMITGGVEDLDTGETMTSQNGIRMITKTKLPIGIDRHCVAGNNAHWLMQRGYNTGKTDMMFAVGGHSNEVNGGYSNRAYIMRCDVASLGGGECGQLVWIRMADMNVAREGPMCGVVLDNGDYKLVVAGGLNKNGYQKTVEIYDMSKDVWKMGKDLPFGPRAFAASVPTPDANMAEYEQLKNPDEVGGMTFYIVGGEGPISNEVWKYNPSGDSWQKMGAKLSSPRTAVTAMIVYQNQFKGC